MGEDFGSIRLRCMQPKAFRSRSSIQICSWRLLSGDLRGANTVSAGWDGYSLSAILLLKVLELVEAVLRYLRRGLCLWGVRQSIVNCQRMNMDKCTVRGDRAMLTSSIVTCVRTSLRLDNILRPRRFSAACAKGHRSWRC